MSDYVTESAETLAKALHEARHVRGGLPCTHERPDDCVGYRASVKDADTLITSGVVRPAAEVRAEALREVERLRRELDKAHEVFTLWQVAEYEVNHDECKRRAEVLRQKWQGAEADLRAALDGTRP